MPSFCPLNEAGSKWISLNVPTDIEEMFAGLNRDGLVSTLIDGPCPGRLMKGLPPLRMRTRKPLHELRQLLAVRRGEHQVPMIRHDAIGQQSHAGSGPSLEESVLKGVIVSFRNEQSRSFGCSIQDVVDKAVTDSVWSSGHLGQKLTTAKWVPL